MIPLYMAASPCWEYWVELHLAQSKPHQDKPHAISSTGRVYALLKKDVLLEIGRVWLAGSVY